MVNPAWGVGWGEKLKSGSEEKKKIMTLEQQRTFLVFNSCGFIVFWVLFFLPLTAYFKEKPNRGGFIENPRS